jgi:hypothetical protein
VLVLETEEGVLRVKNPKCHDFKIFEDSVCFYPSGVTMVLEVLASVSHFAGKLEYYYFYGVTRAEHSTESLIICYIDKLFCYKFPLPFSVFFSRLICY